jgi:hypothetical protein
MAPQHGIHLGATHTGGISAVARTSAASRRADAVVCPAGSADAGFGFGMEPRSSESNGYGKSDARLGKDAWSNEGKGTAGFRGGCAP